VTPARPPGTTGRAGRRQSAASAAAVTVFGMLALGATGCSADAGRAVGYDLPAPSGPARTAVLPTAEPPGPGTGAAPTRIRIPGIGVDAPLETLHLLPDGALDAPHAWGDAGWYADGTRPGDIGPAVIAGHIDSTDGPAVFYRLHGLRSGARIEVESDGRWLGFRATSVARYPKSTFPTAEVYGPTPDAQLRLITCGGDFDRAHRSYLDNVVVFAVAA
jgi:sortase (surface protein transpeptidase)